MSDELHAPLPDPKAGRPVGGTEHSWCKAVAGGTGITVLALLLSRPPDFSLLQTSLAGLRNSRPILRSRLSFNPASNTFSFLTPPPSSAVEIHRTDLPPSPHRDPPTSPLHLILEHELNLNPWSDGGRPTLADTDLMFATVYAVENSKCAVALRFHTGVCDRTSAVSLLRELMKMTVGGGGGGGGEIAQSVGLGIEDLVPEGKGHKPLWARGVDMLGYSLNSLRAANLGFLDDRSPRRSEVVRLEIDSPETDRILEGCKSRGIKLCGAMAAAVLIAARSGKGFGDGRWEKYSVVTLIDCRSVLHPPLPAHQLGFYHSAISNTHDVNGEEDVWELAMRAYASFAAAKNRNKHFSDMGDLNFLMCRAMEAPALTPSSSLRTCLVSVFEEPVMDGVDEIRREIGVEDYMGCASVHGVGPSIAIFDTIREGRLDCAVVYPAPLHSREQIRGLVGEMKRVLLNC